MKRYDAYKDSGIEWLGEVPEHWEERRLKNVADIANSNVDKKICEDGNPVHLCNYTDVYYNEYITSNMTFMEATATDDEIERFSLRRGDVIITKDSEVWNDIGVPSCVNEKLDGVVCGYHLTMLRPKSNVLDGFYLLRALQSDVVQKQFHVAAKGITRYGLSLHHIQNVALTIPPLEEQRAIAAFLDRKTGEIDALIERKRRLIALLTEYRTAVISHAVTKGLNPSAPMKDSDVEWIGEVPEHWDVLALRRVLSRLEQGWSPIAEERQKTEGEWAVVKLSAITRGRFKSDEHKVLPSGVEPIDRLEIKAGDILLTRANTPNLVGEVCFVDQSPPNLMISDLVYRLTAGDRRSHRYLAYWLQSKLGRYQIERDARGSSQSMVKISQSHILSWLHPFPPIEEQQAIAAFIDQRAAEIDATIQREERLIEQLSEYRTALISEAVAGKIDVRDAVPA